MSFANSHDIRIRGGTFYNVAGSINIGQLPLAVDPNQQYLVNSHDDSGRGGGARAPVSGVRRMGRETRGRRHAPYGDGLRKSERKCRHCIEDGVECAFAGATPKRRSYVDILEARLELTERLLRELSHESSNDAPSPASSSGDSPFVGDASTFAVAAPGPGVKHRDASNTCAPGPCVEHRSASATRAPGPGVEFAVLTLRSMNTPAPAPHQDDLAEITLARNLEELSISHDRNRFLGKSSGAMLVKAAVVLREGYEEKEMPWTSRRLRYWKYDPIQHRIGNTATTVIFPASDLMTELVNLYFARTNLYYPVLHRPTFEKSLADGLHLRDLGFGTVLLLVCAIGSRYSDDPRVLAPNEEPMRCGWKYFDQIHDTVNDLFARPSLYKLQYYALATIFVEYSTPSMRWMLVGLGIRLAQDVGAHRAYPRGAKPSVEGELWARAFWVLVCLERQTATALGRPCATQYEDFDVELPIECDDEFWESTDPALVFKQPAGRPSRISFFNCYIRLNNLLAFSIKMLYSLNKAKDLLAVRDDNWEEHIVAELDSALNEWVDLIPSHLRWDPNRSDDVFFDQSAFLHCSYYQVQMTIHRPFIPMIRNGARTALPSLAICTNAARSCSHVADISRHRKDGMPVPDLLSSTFSSGLILLLNVWSGKRTGLPPQLNSAIAEVHKCMAYIRVCEERWQSAGQFWDLLYELATIGQLPLPQTSTPADPGPASGTSTSMSTQNSHKRAQQDDDATEYAHTGAARTNTNTHFAPSAVFQTPIQSQFAGLPTYTADLGRLPVYTQYAPNAASVSTSDSSSNSSWYPQQPSFAGSVGVDSGALGPAPMEPSAFAPAPGGETWFPFNDPHADMDFDPAQASRELGEMMNLIDSDTIAMWTNAPVGFEVDDWGTYFSNFNEIAQQTTRADTGMNGHYGPPT